MLVHILPLASLLSGAALLLLGSGLLTTLLAVRGNIEGFGSPFLGLLGSLFFAGFLVGTRFAPWLIQRIGHIRAFAFFTAAVTCAVLLHELAVSPWVWAPLRLLTGVSMVGLYTIVESWLNCQATPAHRSRIFASYMAVNLGSLALAQQLLHVGVPGGHVQFALAAILICAAAMPVAATRLHPPQVDRAVAIDLRTLYARAPMALAVAFASGLAMGAFWGLGALWADRNGLGTDGVAWFMSLSIIGGAAFQWPIGLCSDRYDRGRVISLVSLAAAACAVLLLLAPQGGIRMVALAGFVYGGFAFALYPMAVARMMDRLDAHEILQGSSGLLLVHGTGAALGPLVAGLAMAQFGPAALPVWFAVTQGILAITASTMMRRVPADVERQARFVPMVRTASTAFDMVGTSARDNADATQDSTDPLPTETH